MKLQKLWVGACHRGKNINVRTARMCGNHFSTDCYDRDLRNELLNLPVRKLLKKGSIPTLELPHTYRSSVDAGKAVKVESPLGNSDERIERYNKQRQSKKLVERLMAEEAKPKDVAVACDIPCPELESLRKLLRETKVQLLKERTKNEKLKREVERLRSRTSVKKERLLRTKLTGAQMKLLLNPGQKYAHYSEEDIVPALVLRRHCPKVYNYLQRRGVSGFPHRRTQERWLKRLQEEECVFGDEAGNCTEDEAEGGDSEASNRGEQDILEDGTELVDGQWTPETTASGRSGDLFEGEVHRAEDGTLRTTVAAAVHAVPQVGQTVEIVEAAIKDEG